MRKLLAAVAIAVAFAAFDKASAQNYPSRPITMVVPFAPGGPTDTIARILAEHMRGSLGQPVIIENVSGAGGSIGVARVARATPDGYTLSVGNLSSHVMNGAIYSLQYDLIGDFAPVGLLSFQPLLIVAKKGLPANSLREFVAWLKANSGKATLEIQGVGTAGHVNAIFFQREIGANLTLVPYRGAGPAMQDLIAGQIDCMIDTPTNSLPQVRAGSIKAYAVTAEDRLSSAREIPTVDEAGVAGISFFILAGSMGAQRHTNSHHREAQRSSGGKPEGIRSYGNALPSRVKKFRRSRSRRRRRSAPITRRRSTSGGRWSRLRTSRPSECVEGISR